jgi:hypothetical protein
MRARRIGLCAPLAVALLFLSVPAAAAQVKAGVAAVDATWHVGASAGQYASDGSSISTSDINPTLESIRRSPSYGVQSRLQVRALVIEGSDGKRIAIVKNDLYIPQDLVNRRTAQILERGDSGITRETLTVPVSHNHSSPYYSTPSWGVWAFQDVFDVRNFDYYAKRMALAVERAAKRLMPVRVGASVSYFDKTHRHSFGGAVADDGTPAGYPVDDTDHDMTVVRFDDVSSPRRPKPLAVLVNFGLHPEFLDGNDLISADYVGPLERMVDRRTKALMIFSQSATGTSEPERSTYHSIHERLEFTHREYAQSEWGARLMANSIIDTWRDIERRTPEDADRFVPFDTSFPVAMEDRWFPGPLSHPYPGVSSCRTDAGLQGDPRVPVVGLPDCVGVFQGPRALADFAGYDEPPTPEKPPVDPGLSTDDLQSRGIPLPENYSFPSYTGLQEDVSIHLQVFRLGDILFTVCPCEQWSDQSRNIETRTNRKQGDIYLGYDWTATTQSAPEVRGTINRPACTRQPDGKWVCPDPRTLQQGLTAKNLPPVDDDEIKRMRAQVLNNASGWNDPEYLPYAESEPVDTTKIKGNFTHDELPASRGYKLTVPIGMANDYNGYIASYREYQRGDHYRKALTGWGPHSSDYMASRLVGLGGHLNGGPDLPAEPGEEKVPADLALNDQKAENLGRIGDTSVRAYEASLPNDGGPIVALEQPKNVERFAAAFFSWNGGSNFTDNPEVRVQRRVNGGWQDFADQSGEVQTTLKYPQGPDVPSYLTGGFKWRWTAHFEAFSSNFATGSPSATPQGVYRFVVDGHHRRGGRVRDYRLISKEFKVWPWTGIKVEDLQLNRTTGTVSFGVGPRRTEKVPAVDEKGAEDEKRPPLLAEIGPVDYPDSYKSPARFVDDEREIVRDPKAPNDPSLFEWYCLHCSFRPWADTGNARTAFVTFVRQDGSRVQVRARERRGRWYATRRLCRGQSAYVGRKRVKDRFGNFNGVTTSRLTGSRRACAAQRRQGAGRRGAGRRGAPRFTG